jgi:hypothetical protein
MMMNTVTWQRGLAVVCLGLLLVAGRATYAEEKEKHDARQLIVNAMRAMGGEEKLKAIKTTSWKVIGQRYMREQSERPTGPWLQDYFQSTVVRDLERIRLREQRQSRGCDSTECWKSAEWQASVLVFSDGVAAQTSDGKFFPARGDAARNSKDWILLDPVRLLISAQDAKDLREESAIEFYGFRQNVVAFSYEGAPVRLILNPGTGLPSGAEITRTALDNVFWGPWGDITTRVSWTFWELERGGVRYPRQWDAESNGRPNWTMTINEWTINPETKDDTFAIPAETAAAIRGRNLSIEELPLGNVNAPAIEVAPGILQVPGSWNVEEVELEDGIAILEGPISSGYSAKTIADAEKRFAGKKVQMVVTTSDAWPHLGGMREYAARGIEIYALDLNKPILEQLFEAPHQMKPDELERHPRKPVWHMVSGRTVAGDKERRMEIIPLRTQTGERQMFVYFPFAKLLYTSDLFQKDGQGNYFLPQTMSEAVDVVKREKLDVEAVFGMHLAKTDWKEIVAAVEKQASGSN